MDHSYGEIPESVRTKRYFPLGRHLWRLYRALGWQDYLGANIGNAISTINYDLVKIRLNEAIMTAKATMEGTIPNPEIVIADTLFPPGGSVRADLQQGIMKLYYGESCDCTYLSIRDDTQEVCLMLNAHLENGIPVDWWFIGAEDELLERRHIKMGYKLRDIPKKSKNLTEMGFKFIDILRDIRNERTPQWINSPYQTAAVWSTGAWNLGFEFSSYEGIAGLYDGVAAKFYGLPDHWYVYVPWPPLIETAIYSGRKKFTILSVGLMAESRLYFQHLEDDWQNVTKTNFPEIWDVGIVQQLEKMGVPFPKQTLECELPNYKDGKTYQNEQFEWHYPPGSWITLDRLQMDLKTALNGYYFDIDHETNSDLADIPSRIISKGIGRNTQIIHHPSVIQKK